jgi:hypothetical protein
MLSISAFKNILQYSGMEFNFDNEFYSNKIFLRYPTIIQKSFKVPSTIYLYRVIY